MIKRTFRRSVFALTILALISCAKGSAEAPETPVTPEKKELKLMTYNIHIANPPSKGEGFVDIAAIVKVINQEKPDLVALQEVDRFTIRSGKDLDQAKAIAEGTGMKFYFAKALDRSGGDYGVAILSKFPILGSKTVSLPVVSGTGAELRALGLAEVTLADSKKIVFASVHLDHLADKNRELQAREAVKALLAYKDVPVFLGGDFNMTPDNPVWNIIREQFVMGCTSCPGTAPATNPTRTIDYLLLNKHAAASFTVRNYYTIEDKYASDHLPVVMKLEYE